MQQNHISIQISRESIWIIIFLCQTNTTTSLSMYGVRMLTTMEWLHLCTILYLLEFLPRMDDVSSVQVRALQVSLLSQFQVSNGMMGTTVVSLSIVSSTL